jgi:hypothetical protein
VHTAEDLRKADVKYTEIETYCEGIAMAGVDHVH